MSIIEIPSTIESAPEASQPLLKAVNAQLGSVPNLFRIAAKSPKFLEGYLGLNGALGGGALSLQIREKIALRVAELNGCSYCLAAHNYLGTNLAKLSEQDVLSARKGLSETSQESVALNFVSTLVTAKGKVTEFDVTKVLEAGYSEEQLIEMVGNVALNILTNYLNEALKTDIDFPVVD